MTKVNHCGHCLRKTSTPIPCYECATVQYCGETCRDLSWEQYHRYLGGKSKEPRYLGGSKEPRYLGGRSKEYQISNNKNPTALSAAS